MPAHCRRRIYHIVGCSLQHILLTAGRMRHGAPCCVHLDKWRPAAASVLQRSQLVLTVNSDPAGRTVMADFTMMPCCTMLQHCPTCYYAFAIALCAGGGDGIACHPFGDPAAYPHKQGCICHCALLYYVTHRALPIYSVYSLDLCHEILLKNMHSLHSSRSSIGAAAAPAACPCATSCNCVWLCVQASVYVCTAV